MRQIFFLAATCLGLIPAALAGEVLSATLNRQSGGKPVVISAFVQMAEKPNGKAIQQILPLYQF